MTGHSFRVHRFERLESTQDEARSQARRGAPSGTVILAGEQTRGRGRQGRAWESPAGLGLWFTVIHRTSRASGEWPLFALAAALGVSEGIDGLGLRSGLKWPNDVLLSDGKVAGILADTERDAILIGIGLNVLQKKSDFPFPLRGVATSIALECSKAGLAVPDRESVLDAVLASLKPRLLGLEAGASGPILAGFWDRCASRNKRIEVVLPSGEPREGDAIGLAPDGRLLLKTEREIIKIAAGEITHGGDV